MSLLAFMAVAFAGRVVDHEGRIDGNGIEWQSAIDVGVKDVTFANPIPEDQVVEVIGGSPIRLEGAIHGVISRGTHVTVVVRQPDQSPLRPPLVLDPDALQQVWVDGHRFDPDPALGMVLRMGWSADRAIRTSDRRRLKGALGLLGRELELGSVLLVVDAPTTQGITGDLVRRGGGKVRSSLLALGAVIATLLGLFGANRWLERAAKRERLAAYLAGVPDSE